MRISILLIGSLFISCICSWSVESAELMDAPGRLFGYYFEDWYDSCSSHWTDNCDHELAGMIAVSVGIDRRVSDISKPYMDEHSAICVRKNEKIQDLLPIIRAYVDENRSVMKGYISDVVRSALLKIRGCESYNLK